MQIEFGQETQILVLAFGLFKDMAFHGTGVLIGFLTGALQHLIAVERTNKQEIEQKNTMHAEIRRCKQIICKGTSILIEECDAVVYLETRNRNTYIFVMTFCRKIGLCQSSANLFILTSDFIAFTEYYFLNVGFYCFFLIVV